MAIYRVDYEYTYEEYDYSEVEVEADSEEEAEELAFDEIYEDNVTITGITRLDDEDDED